ncbi:hypothetical protein BH23ACI1_BH23ACI1_19330 [soil metagenome]
MTRPVPGPPHNGRRHTNALAPTLSSLVIGTAVTYENPTMVPLLGYTPAVGRYAVLGSRLETPLMRTILSSTCLSVSRGFIASPGSGCRSLRRIRVSK